MPFTFTFAFTFAFALCINGMLALDVLRLALGCSLLFGELQYHQYAFSELLSAGS